MTKTSIDRLIKEAERSEISSTHAMLSRIAAVINNPHAGAFDLKRVIETDPPLAMRVLKRANSAFYGAARNIEGILEAIICIGFETIKELALHQTACELFRKDDVVYGYSRSSLWLHCVAVALCGKFIYRREFQMSGEQIYAVGLLHDIGVIAENQFAREQFMKVLKNFSLKPETGMYACERQLLGFTHAELGSAMMRHWNFPEPMSQAVSIETLPDALAAGDAVMTTTLCVARWACQQRKIGFVETPPVLRRDMGGGLRYLNITKRGLEFIMDAVELEIGKMHDEGWF